jgi:transcription elongation factor Elf1
LLYLDRKYTLLVSGRLRNFQQKNNDLFNFSCPFCGDSKKNLRKARGYIYARENDYFYKCWNCGVGTNFYGFMKFVDPINLRNYVMERFVDARKGKTATRAEISDVLVPERKEELMLSLHTIDLLPEGHYAKEYIKNRKIPESAWSEIYYTDNFKKFMDDFFPGHGKEGLLTDARIILPCTDFDGNYTHIAGRALEGGDKALRYQIVTILKDVGKGFGLHRLSKDYNEKVYITEGQFDSFFLPNAVASGDSNLLGLAHRLRDRGYKNVVLVYDAEPRNKDLTPQIEKAIKDNQFVALLPYNENAKDINEFINLGITPEEMKAIVDKNTFKGLVANLKFAKWRKS